MLEKSFRVRWEVPKRCPSCLNAIGSFVSALLQSIENTLSLFLFLVPAFSHFSFSLIEMFLFGLFIAGCCVLRSRHVSLLFCPNCDLVNFLMKIAIHMDFLDKLFFHWSKNSSLLPWYHYQLSSIIKSAGVRSVSLFSFQNFTSRSINLRSSNCRAPIFNLQDDQ